MGLIWKLKVLHMSGLGIILVKLILKGHLKELSKADKKLFRMLKNHFLVIKVVYAEEFKLTVEVERDGKFEAEASIKELDFEGNANIEKKENAILVSNNKEIPFGVVCYKIKKGTLKEKDK